MRLFLMCVLLLVPASLNRAEACTCQTPGPPCATMFLSTVFVGTVTAVSQQANGATVTTFTVTDTLNSKRPLGKSVDVHHSAIGSMCGTNFEKGKTYVVYAGGEEQLSTGACSRTHLFRNGDEDVAFAHAKRTRTEALVEGVTVLTDAGPQANVEVRAVGTKVASKSDKQGKFKLMLPPGDYELEVVTAGLRAWRGERPKVSLPVADACANVTVNLSIDGRIEGRLTDAKGQPIVGLEVFAEAEREKDRHWRLSGKTDSDGKYVVHEVPAGSFYVGVSLPSFGGTSPTTPYVPTWFPGVAEVKTARLVKLQKAGVVSGIDFALPDALVVSKVRGSVKRKDGSVPAGVYVTVTPAGGQRSTSGPVDAKGEFTFDELSGLEITVKACVFDPKQTCAEEKRKLSGDVTVPLVIP
ncbi:MAG: carboxypeptidase regulatory-like domain-containing protein [Archangium sp.]|nr:carboxypeptidase regulatory-like domain-containing protein [Archangium sp.]